MVVVGDGDGGTPMRTGAAILLREPPGTMTLGQTTHAGGVMSAGAVPTVSVVIPTLNEAANLRSILRELPPEYELVVVDGHSTDGTVGVVHALRPDASVVQQPGLGKGDALAEGFKRATGDVIVTFDADRSAATSEIPRFVDALAAGAQFAKGSRYLAGGGSDDLTRLRSFGNRVLTALVNRLYGTEYTDLCYGYNAFWRRLTPLFDVERTGFEVETLLALRVAQAGLVVTEVPSYEACRGYGVGKLHTFRDGWRVLRAIVLERWRQGRVPRGRRSIRPDIAIGALRRAHAIEAALPEAPRRRASATGPPRSPGVVSPARGRAGAARARRAARASRARTRALTPRWTPR
jgi:hypothetical protein